MQVLNVQSKAVDGFIHRHRHILFTECNGTVSIRGGQIND